MAAFTPKIGAVQSADGKTLILQDLGNWVGNDQGYLIGNFNRQVVVRNSSLAIVSTVNFTGSELTANLNITKDQWFKLEYSAIGTPNLYSIATIGLNRFTRNAKLKLMNIACKDGCGNKRVNNKLISAEPYITGSDYAAESGNGVQYDDAISNAYAYLTL